MHLKKAGGRAREKVLKKTSSFSEGSRHFHKMHRHNTKKIYKIKLLKYSLEKYKLNQNVKRLRFPLRLRDEDFQGSSLACILIVRASRFSPACYQLKVHVLQLYSTLKGGFEITALEIHFRASKPQKASVLQQPLQI